MCRNSMSKSDAARIQASQARSGGDMSSGGFAARAQAAVDRNVKSESASSIKSDDGSQSSEGQGVYSSSSTSVSGSKKK